MLSNFDKTGWISIKKKLLMMLNKWTIVIVSVQDLKVVLLQSSEQLTWIPDAESSSGYVVCPCCSSKPSRCRQSDSWLSLLRPTGRVRRVGSFVSRLRFVYTFSRCSSVGHTSHTQNHLPAAFLIRCCSTRWSRSHFIHYSNSEYCLNLRGRRPSDGWGRDLPHTL